MIRALKVSLLAATFLLCSCGDDGGGVCADGLVPMGGACVAPDGCVPREWYPDTDGDGFGVAEGMTEACTPPMGFVGESGDCDDSDDGRFPAADELCDGVDQDCDGSVDEESADSVYLDADGDGHGDPATPRMGCDSAGGYVASNRDCDDTDSGISPDADEACNGVDDDCDGAVDEAGSASYYADADGDGFGDPASPASGCAMPAGYVEDATDCDDDCASCQPGGLESCDGRDNDCDGSVDEEGGSEWWADCDGDGFAAASAESRVACEEPASTGSCTGGWTETPPSGSDADCRDDLADVFPGQTAYFDEPTPGIVSFDYDCDGTESRETTRTFGGCGTFPGCGSSSGWSGAVPSCGASGELRRCGTGVSSCTTTTTTETQGCR